MSPASQRATRANSDAPSTARAVGQMKGSEARIDMRVAIVYTVRDGLIVRGREFASREEALEAAGLSVQTGSSLAFLMHFLRFLAFALPLNFLHFLIAAAR